jgi:hypothetical protein
MFTLNTMAGHAVINGLGQILLFATEAQANAYAEASEELRGRVSPYSTYAPLVEVAEEVVEQFI